jgi:hypothetical protein
MVFTLTQPILPAEPYVMQHTYIKILRWVMVIPAAVIGWWLAIIIGLSLTHIPEYFCPPEFMVSDLCMAPWYGPILSGILIFSAALSAFLVLVVAVLVAPSHRALVAKGVFVAGSLYATYLAFTISAWAECAGAIICGLVTLFWLIKKYGRRVAN